MGLSKYSTAHRYVDMWALPGAHPCNIEILQKLKSADSQHFTKNMDIVGTVSGQKTKQDDWQKTHLIGVRTDVWKPSKKELAGSLKVVHQRRKQELKKEIKRSGRLDPKQTDRLQKKLDEDQVMQMEANEIENRRLVLKLFKTTTSRVRWCGTIEEVTTTEVHNSLGSKRPLITMVVMLPNVQLVTYVQQNHRTARIPKVFTFCFYDERRMWHVTLSQRWVSWGPDYDVLADGQSIGLLDSKLMSLGSDSYLDLEPHPLTNDTAFLDLLTLFASSIGYHRAMRRSIKRRVKAVKAGQSHRHLIEDEELRLRHNGRAAA